MDEDLVQNGMDVKNFVLTNAQFETVSIVQNTYHHPQRETSTPSYTGTVSLAGIWITSSKSSRIPWRSSESGGSDPVSQAQEMCSSVCGLIEKLINMPNLSGGKGALTPGGKDIWRDVRDSDGELEYSEAKLVQAAAGLEQYIALDRPGIAYSVKTLQQMSKPTKLMQLRVVRVGRYLKNNPRLVWKFPYQQGPRLEWGSADRVCIQYAERASTEHRRSEFYAISKGSGHSLHSLAILKGFGVTVVLSGASAGIGIASRQGCGRLKHLEMKWLWVQEKVSEKALRLRKHPTETNTADLATK